MIMNRTLKYVILSILVIGVIAEFGFGTLLYIAAMVLLVKFLRKKIR